jgi:hypothetical protein
MQVQYNETSTSNNHVLAGIGEVEALVCGVPASSTRGTTLTLNAHPTLALRFQLCLFLLAYLPSVWSLQGNGSQEACTLLVSYLSTPRLVYRRNGLENRTIGEMRHRPIPRLPALSHQRVTCQRSFTDQFLGPLQSHVIPHLEVRGQGWCVVELPYSAKNLDICPVWIAMLHGRSDRSPRGQC